MGSSFVSGRVSLRARLVGTPEDTEVRIDLASGDGLRILGETFQVPSALLLHVGPAGLRMDQVRARAASGAGLDVSGRIAMSGDADLSLSIEAFPFQKLPGLVEAELPLTGRLSGHLELRGPPGRQAVSGRLALGSAEFQGRPIGGGALTITPDVRGGIHAIGHIIEGVAVDGTLRPARGGGGAGAGLVGEVALDLHQVKLDPFLPWLPGGMSAAGIVSGRARARTAPGRPATIEGHLTQLALLVRGRNPDDVLEFHATRGVTMRAGDGGIRLEPTHFAGNAGTLELAGETRGLAASGSVRGHLDLGAARGLVAPWLDRVAGAIDLDFAATRTADAARPNVVGRLAIVEPIAMRFVGVPVDAAIAPGRIDVADDRVSTSGLALALGGLSVVVKGGASLSVGGGVQLAATADGDLDLGTLFASLPLVAGAPSVASTLHTGIGRVSGAARVHARISGALAAPILQARIDLSRLELGLRQPLPGLASQGSTLLFPRGRLELTVARGDGAVAVTDLEFRLGSSVELGLGRPPSTPGRVRWRWEDGAMVASSVVVDLPVAGRLRWLATPAGTVDDARLAVRLTGSPARRLRLAGDLEVLAAHRPASLPEMAGTGLTDGGPGGDADLVRLVPGQAGRHGQRPTERPLRSAADDAGALVPVNAAARRKYYAFGSDTPALLAHAAAEMMVARFGGCGGTPRA